MSTRPMLAELDACLSDVDPRAVPVDRARDAIGRIVAPIDCVERVAIRASLGRVLARDVVSPIDVPAHDNSAMDGWALRSRDLAPEGDTTLVPVGAAHAGVPFEGTVGPGEAVRVMTGALMPPECDTVAMQEAVRVDGPRIVVPAGQRAGQHRRLRGEDLARGRPALPAGRLLRPADLGLLASLGIAEAPVQRRLRVAFFSTGDELRSVGEPLDPGCVYDSNRYTLHGMLVRLGVELLDLGVVRDAPDALEAAMRAASASADAIVSSGGVSVGDADYTREVMGRLGEVAFWSLAMRPGRPLAFGRIGGAWYFGLPGNPVAVMVTFLCFVRDALIRLSGASPRPVLPLRARSVERLRKRPGRTEYQRAIVGPGPDGVLQARITGHQGSGVLRSMSEANALVVLPHDAGDVAAGDWVDAIPFDGLM
ncbi:MAG TPA: molybdopterin-binding protein [Burkholderiaceae bacterium]|nr:molybdopterin-binding protein [Burkholderiaceae bacterium]